MPTIIWFLYVVAALGSWWLATAITFTHGVRLGRGEQPFGLFLGFGLYALMAMFIVQAART